MTLCLLSAFFVHSSIAWQCDVPLAGATGGKPGGSIVAEAGEEIYTLSQRPCPALLLQPDNQYSDPLQEPLNRSCHYHGTAATRTVCPMMARRAGESTMSITGLSDRVPDASRGHNNQGILASIQGHNLLVCHRRSNTGQVFRHHRSIPHFVCLRARVMQQGSTLLHGAVELPSQVPRLSTSLHVLFILFLN